MAEPLIRVENLHTCIDTPSGVVRAVDGVSFEIHEGETLGLVGESGCGKSMTALSILQLLPEPAGYISEGRILFRGRDLLDHTWDEMRSIRGRQIAMIFQEPMTSLNPVFTIGRQLAETMVVHGTDAAAARRRSLELLEQVQLDEPGQLLRQYPHQLSGGMQQRVMIAIALANGPQLLIADEPTTALDVTVQAQILTLLAELQQEMGMAVLLISHDLGIVAEMADRVAVMYAGEIVETASAEQLYSSPRHPYTQGLFASLPTREQRGKDLMVLEGIVPDPLDWPPGCRFEPRCPQRFEACCRTHPPAYETAAWHEARCLLYSPEQANTPTGAAS